jgi:hypothetical protein
MRSIFALVLLIGVGGGCKKSSPGAVFDCNDHVTDGNETDVDCGGPMCTACGSNMACKQDRDCQSKLCNSDGKCQPPSCSDNLLNGSETDVDCGGPDCPPCAAGKMCAGDNDCRPNLCVHDGGVCGCAGDC